MAKGNVIAGNVLGFGATGGHVYAEGQVGDRAGLRNSGAVIVCEGVGNYACEYMTSGMFINLGKAGKDFGVGMSGGIAIQYDPKGQEMKKMSGSKYVEAYSTKDKSQYQDAIKKELEEYRDRTGSLEAARILDNWKEEKHNFSVIIPKALQKRDRYR